MRQANDNDLSLAYLPPGQTRKSGADPSVLGQLGSDIMITTTACGSARQFVSRLHLSVVPLQIKSNGGPI